MVVESYYILATYTRAAIFGDDRKEIMDVNWQSGHRFWDFIYFGWF